MPLSETVLIVMGLLAVAMVAAGICRKLPVPDTVILVIVGICLGELSKTYPAFAMLAEFRLSPDLVFFVLLPALIFESGFNLDARQLLKDLPPVLVLAIPALLISTAFIGLMTWLILDMDLRLALLFGALISATDPVAVIALFKELGAPQRLNVLVEGESLLNDATAIVVFGILLTLAASGATVSWSVFGAAVVSFVTVFVGGAVVGAVVGLAISELLYRLKSGLSAVLTMSIVMAYLSFILAEHVLHVSGVMAAAAAALALGGYGVTRMRHETTNAIGEVWEVIALICNSLLFLLVGLSVDIAGLGSRMDVIAIAVVVVLAARALAVYPLVPMTTRLFSLPRVTMGERHIMWWGGLKGGLAIAIVLSVPEDLPGRQLLTDMTLGVVLFTLLVNAPTIRPLMSRLGLDRLTDDERSELRHGLLDARQRAEQTLGRFQAAGIVSTGSQHRVDRNIRETLAADVAQTGAPQETREVYLAALRTEQETLRQMYELGVITQYTYLDMRNALQRDREAHGTSTTTGSAVPPSGVNIFLRLEMALLRRLREKDWATGILSRYQDIRLAQHVQQNIAGILMCEAVLEQLKARGDAQDEQRRCVAVDYENRLERRRGRIETLKREYPAFFQRFESRLFSRVALNSALGDARQEHHDGEIGAKAYTHIERRVKAALEALPPLSEPLPRFKPRELIETVPLLAGLSEQSLEALAQQATPVTFLANDIVIGEGQKGDALYIITHGEVTVHRKDPDGVQRIIAALGEGDVFGEGALLGDHKRAATVKARVPSTLLRLSRRDVLALADRTPEVKRRLQEVREARMIKG